MSHVDIGFIEPCEPWQVVSAQFPNKVGGKPAWLEYENFPTFEELQCETCKNQTIFLCQVYAPFEECEENFHRTLFLFICRTTACCIKNNSKNIKIFRSNLRRLNKYYSDEPPGEEPVIFDSTKYTKLCELCGCPGEKNCGKCKNAVYCCREHQVIHWKEIHKRTCGQTTAQVTPSIHLFPEFEIVVDAEELEERAVDESRELENYRQLESDGKTGTLSEVELEEHASADKDKVFTQFRKRISHNPDQVLRYERRGSPLWIAKGPVPDDVPECEYCGYPRQFEFQIMPQLLTILKEHEIDFGVLAVYTCEKSCFARPGYKKEFVFKQDVTDSD